MNNPAPPPRKALGRGLEALLPSPRPASAPIAPSPGSSDGVSLIELGRIRPNPFQPRKRFDTLELQELAESIRAQGILQPILVRMAGNDYQLIAGERRFRAAQILGLATIPALIRALDDERTLEIAIIENLQRADLNPLEQARAFHELSQRFQLTQEQIAQKTGKERATVANFLRLLKLDLEVQAMLEDGRLSMGQTRPLIGLEPALQRTIANQILGQGLSARQVEERVSALLRPPDPATPAKPRDPNVTDAEEQLSRSLGTRVHISGGKSNRGAIALEYSDLDDFQRLFERLLRT